MNEGQHITSKITYYCVGWGVKLYSLTHPYKLDLWVQL